MDLVEKLLMALLPLIGGSVGWYLKSKIENHNKREDILRAERAVIYMDILTPFAQLFTDLSKKSQTNALEKLKSLEYRKLAFQLTLLASDDVLNSWNKMWNTIYDIEKGIGKNTDILLSFGDVLLALRKEVGTKTKLNNKDMLYWLIKDIKEIQN